MEIEGELTTVQSLVGDVIPVGPQGETGNGIESITLTSTVGRVKTYTILFTDGTTTTFQVTDGEKGDAGAIKMLIVDVLPAVGADDTIYLVPLVDPEETGNNYAEYVYINGAWELLGKIGVHVDLSDYAKKTDANTFTDIQSIESNAYSGINLNKENDITTFAHIGHTGIMFNDGNTQESITYRNLASKTYVQQYFDSRNGNNISY